MSVINQILPGVYGRVIAGEREANLSARGTVAMALDLDWGAPVTVLLKGNDTLTALGYDIMDPKIKLVAEVMYNAGKLVLYRLNAGQGQPAQATLVEGVTVKAIYNGKRGNDIKVSVKADGDVFIIRTYLGTREVDAQSVKTPDDFKRNSWISITGTGKLLEVEVPLTSGSNGEATQAEGYSAFFDELHNYEFNILCYTGTDTTTKNKYIAYMDKLEAMGKYAQCVMNEPGVHSTKIINSTIGGGPAAYDLTAPEACATVAGLLADCGIENSATFKTIAHWTKVNPRLDRWQQQQRVQAGEFLIVERNRRICALYDINTLTEYDSDHPADWSKNLVIRTLSAIVSDIDKMLTEKVIGRIRNSRDGRAQVKGMTVDLLMTNYQDKGYIEGFSPDDVTVKEAPDAKRDSIAVIVGVRVVDTADKIYLTVISK